MTDYTATPEQWAAAEHYGDPGRNPRPMSEYACILELRARIEALEAVLTKPPSLAEQAPQPVSVHERPWEREGWCDAEGKCWWGRGESDDWSADWTLATPEAVAEFCEFSPQTVCLPAHALPLPEVAIND